MTTDKSPETAPGYRGALPPRDDWLARGWVLVVIAIFFLIFILAALNVPTVLLPEPTASPTPISSPASSGSPAASGSVAPSATAAPTGSPSPSP